MDDDLKRDIIGWDLPVWGQAFDVWAPVMNSPPKRFLEIGANKGGLSLWAARCGHDVTCSDYGGVSSSAHTLHDKYGVSPKYHDVNALDITLKDFDVIASKSVLVSVSRLGGLPAMRAAIESIHQSLVPGGHFLFAENMAGTHLHRFARTRFTRWASGLTYPTDAEWNDLLSCFSVVTRSNFGFLNLFGPTNSTREALGRLDIAANSAIPNSWKTVTIGIARK